jgi:queuine tRNA-ribosyltransferase
MEDMRQAIAEDRLLEFREETLSKYGYFEPNARLF